MTGTIVALTVVVCLGGAGSEPEQCEEFAISIWRGQDAMALCQAELVQELAVASPRQQWECQRLDDWHDTQEGTDSIDANNLRAPQ